MALQRLLCLLRAGRVAPPPEVVGAQHRGELDRDVAADADFLAVAQYDDRARALRGTVDVDDGAVEAEAWQLLLSGLDGVLLGHARLAFHAEEDAAARTHDLLHET